MRTTIVSILFLLIIIPVCCGNIHNYYAVMYTDSTNWSYGVDVDGFQFEWSLVKCDKYGNYMAIKDIGTGPVIALEIPKNHEYFRLLLTTFDGKLVTTDITTLHTPLYEQKIIEK